MPCKAKIIVVCHQSASKGTGRLMLAKVPRDLQIPLSSITTDSENKMKESVVYIYVPV
jgi:hypothetical protein